MCHILCVIHIIWWCSYGVQELSAANFASKFNVRAGSAGSFISSSYQREGYRGLRNLTQKTDAESLSETSETQPTARRTDNPQNMTKLKNPAKI